MRSLRLFFLALFSSLLVVLSPAIALAQAPASASAGCDPGVSGIDITNCLLLNNKGQTVGEVYTNPAVLVNTIVRNLISIGGVFLFVMIFYAGFKFIQSGTKGKDDAKQIIKTAVTGFIIMLAAYWIIQILEVVTGTPILL
jgi:hypothetical protein